MVKSENSSLRFSKKSHPCYALLRPSFQRRKACQGSCDSTLRALRLGERRFCFVLPELLLRISRAQPLAIASALGKLLGGLRTSLTGSRAFLLFNASGATMRDAPAC